MSSTYKPPGPIVEIEWIDSMAHSGWQSRTSMAASCDEETMLEHRTTGYLFKRTRRYVAVVQSYGVGGSGLVGEAIQIPRPAIRRVVVIRK